MRIGYGWRPALAVAGLTAYLVVGTAAAAASGSAAAPAPAMPSLSQSVRAQPAAASVSLGLTADFVDDRPTVTATVTNERTSACLLSSQSGGAIHVVSVTRDGRLVQPAMRETYTYDGLDADVGTSLVAVAATESRRIPVLGADAQAGGVIGQLDDLADGRTVESTWSITEPGTYQISAIYAAPAESLPAGSTESLCSGPSNLAAIAFNVSSSKITAVWLGLGTLVLFLLGAGAALWAARREFAGRVVAAVGVIVLALGTSVVTAPRSYADLDGGGGDLALDSALGDCVDLYSQPGNDPAGLLPDIKQNNYDIHVQRRSVGKTGKGTVTVATGQEPMIDNSSIIYWDPTKTVFPEKVPTTPCVVLYHELQHAVDIGDGVDIDGDCGGVPVADVHAVASENQLRVALGQKQVRTSYHGHKLPKLNFDQCEKKLHPDAPDPRHPFQQGAYLDRFGHPIHRPASRPAAGGQPSGADSGPAVTGGDAGSAGAASTGKGASGTAHGDPHYLTLDHQFYDLQTVGEYDAVLSKTGAVHIQVRTSALPGSDQVSLVNAVVAKVGGSRIGFYGDDGRIGITLDGKPVGDAASTALPGGAFLSRQTSTTSFAGYKYTVSWSDQAQLLVNAHGGFGLDVVVVPGRSWKGAVSGLLGNDNGDPSDDFTTRDGKSVPTGSDPGAIAEQFGDSWRISDATSLFDYNPGQTTATFTDRNFPVSQATPIITPSILQVCTLAGAGSDPLLSACALDVATTGQASMAAASGSIAASTGIDDIADAAAATAVSTAPSAMVTTPALSSDTDTAVAAPPTETTSAVPTSSGTGFGPGTTVSGTVDSNTPKSYTFTAQAGQVAYFKADPTCQKSDALVGVRGISGEVGEIHGILGACTDFGRVTFTKSGEFSLDVTGAGSYAVTWVVAPADVNAPLTFGQTTSGTLAVGARFVYTFHAEAGQPLTIIDKTPPDQCVALQNETWYVANPDGIVGARNIFPACTDMDEVDLDTGDYELVVDSNGSAGTFGFLATR